MLRMRTIIPGFLREISGNIAITAALTSPLLAATLALGVDYGYLTLQRRDIQQAADLSAISGASDINNAEKAVLDYFRLNNRKLGVKTATGLLTTEGLMAFDPEQIFSTMGGYAEVTKGRYVADPDTDVGQRFVADALPANAVKVNIIEKGEIFFASAFTTPPTLSAAGTAASTRLASFSIGSRLISLDGGLLNSLLGKLLGTSISLNAMDYKALLDADVNALHIVETLALDLGLTAGTYKDVLETEITYGQFLSAITKATGIKPTVTAALRTIERAVNKTTIKLKVAELISVGPLSEQLIGTGNNLKVMASVFDMVSAGAVAGNNSKQIAVDLGAGIPGLASTKVTLAIGEPPVGTPPLAVGTQGSIVRTAQTRLALDVSIDGLQAIAGVKVHVPLYVEVAHAEAKLTDIRCIGGGQGNVDIDVVPGIAEIALGDVDTAAFANFGTKPRVKQTSVVDSTLLKINGMAHINASNMKKTRLSFQPTDVSQAVVKNVSTKDTITSLVSSLLKNLDLEIRLLFISIGTPTAIQAALADTLSLATKPIDTVLYNTLLVLGVKIGEADVRVTDVRCMHPALVQ